MLGENEPDRLKGPGGLSLRQIHRQVRRSAELDRAAAQGLQKRPIQDRGAWAGLLAAWRRITSGEK
jgi:hypothetical protein